VVEWKRGFYYIARGAGVPIVMAVVDGRHKTVHIGQVFHPTENAEEDLKAIQGYFAGASGVKPRRKYITLES
jgi:1-acyl-sn-glycerol-3-phosphate acyltransferase